RQPKRIRFEYIHKVTDAKRTVKKLCSWLSVSPAGYYKWLKQLPSTRHKENSSLLKFLKHVSYQEHCIPGLRRQFNVDTANTVWVSDITQVRCKDGWQYLCVILDLYSRKVVGWVTSRINNAELVIKTLRKAWSARNPDGANLLFHSDQGAQYVAKETVKWLTNRGVTVSMSRKGNCWDNACSESFFAQYKKEWIKNLNELSRSEMTTQTYFYIEKYYNSVRRHGTLGYKSPMQYEQIN
ncbi:IS3 family transposase, partial [Pseudoalteromonas sp.]|uniref:IS3 family transposase n=2 Tax=Pseudoalteromonas TaxID=53246 RepID=UPI003511147F